MSESVIEARRTWRATDYVAARVWFCGDDECDCSEAVVERITPNLGAGFPFIHRETVAKGPFYTDGEGWIDGRVRMDAEYLATVLGVEVLA